MKEMAFQARGRALGGEGVGISHELQEAPHGWRHEQKGTEWRPEPPLTGSLSNSLHLSLLIQIADLKAKHPTLYFTLISTL